MKLAIDFDGVLHDDKNIPPGRKMGRPITGAKEAMIELAKDNFVVIFTVRATGYHETKAVTDWLNYFEIPYGRVTNIKGNYDLFIDDRAIHFLNWPQALADIHDR